MISNIFTCAVSERRPYLVTVESDVHNGLPDFKIVGATSQELKDAKDRVRVGIENAGFILPPKRITVNLVPAPLKKTGTIYDAAIAASVLTSFGFIHAEDLSEYMILGEVSLDGTLRAATGVLFSVCFGKSIGINKFIVPTGNLAECSVLSDVTVIGIKSIYDMAVYFNGDVSVAQEAEVFTEKDFEYPDINDKSIQEKLKKYAETGESLLITGKNKEARRKICEALAGIIKPSKEDVITRASFQSIDKAVSLEAKEISGVPVYYFGSDKEYNDKLMETGTFDSAVVVFEDNMSEVRAGRTVYSFYNCKCRAESEKYCTCSLKLRKDRQILFERIIHEKKAVLIDLNTEGEGI